MPAGQGARRAIASETRNRNWANMPGSGRTRSSRRIRSARRSRTPGSSMTCTETCGSGARIGMIRDIMRVHRRTIRRGLQRARATCFAAVAGTTRRVAAARHSLRRQARVPRLPHGPACFAVSSRQANEPYCWFTDAIVRNLTPGDRFVLGTASLEGIRISKWQQDFRWRARHYHAPGIKVARSSDRRRCLASLPCSFCCGRTDTPWRACQRGPKNRHGSNPGNTSVPGFCRERTPCRSGTRGTARSPFPTEPRDVLP